MLIGKCKNEYFYLQGKKKIFEGKNVNAVLEEEIKDLAEKLEELKKSCKNKDVEVRHCINFDKKACHLQKRLEKLGGLTHEKTLKELQSTGKETKNNTSTDVSFAFLFHYICCSYQINWQLIGSEQELHPDNIF